MDYSAEFTEQFQNMDPMQQKVSAIVMGIIVILAIIAEWKVFTKAGEKGWYSLIPILREYKLVKIADGKGIKFLLFIIPIVNIIYGIIFCNRLAQSFGKGVGFTIGLIFLPNIFQLILGFGSAQYIGPKGEQQRLGYTNN